MTFGKRQPPGYRGINRRSAATREPVDMPAEILVPGARPLECPLTRGSVEMRSDVAASPDDPLLQGACVSSASFCLRSSCRSTASCSVHLLAAGSAPRRPWPSGTRPLRAALGTLVDVNPFCRQTVTVTSRLASPARGRSRQVATSQFPTKRPMRHRLQQRIQPPSAGSLTDFQLANFCHPLTKRIFRWCGGTITLNCFHGRKINRFVCRTVSRASPDAHSQAQPSGKVFEVLTTKVYENVCATVASGSRMSASEIAILGNPVAFRL